MNYQIRNLDKKFWPKSLLEMPRSQTPKKLKIKGTDPDWCQKRICIIGSRNFSDYGEAVCQKIIEDLSPYPITIVSGLAYGIDSLAHRFALKNKMKTISIPGSGLNDEVIYPQRHFDLSQQIIKEGGCLISEYENDQPAAIWTFPQRNRIMAGISDLVLIIEAIEKSGTMITARLALDYNIDVACVPGSIFNKNSKGTHKLLKEGASLISCVDDILEILNIEKTPEQIKKNISEILNAEEIAVFNLIENSLTKDELLNKSGVEIYRLNQILSTLEIHNLIEFLENKICQK